MNKRWLKLAAVPVALSFVAAACGSDDDERSSDTTAGTEATDGPRRPADRGTDGSDATARPATSAARPSPSPAPSATTRRSPRSTTRSTPSATTNNITIEYTGDADWEANINTQVEGGNPPDISLFPQPGKLADFARAGVHRAARPTTSTPPSTSTGSTGYQPTATSTACSTASPSRPTSSRSSGTSRHAFEDAGYAVPETFDEFTRADRRDGSADGTQAAVRRHRVRQRDRLDLHRLGRGHGAASVTAATSTTSG